MASLERSEAGDEVRAVHDRIRRDFDLDEDLNDPIDDYAQFRDRIQALRYQERFAREDPQVIVSHDMPSLRTDENESTVSEPGLRANGDVASPHEPAPENRPTRAVAEAVDD